MFHTKGSRLKLEAGNTLVLNAACGLRTRKYFESSEGPSLPYDIHVAALIWWLWLVTERKLKDIWLAGKWARTNTNFEAGESLSAEEYLSAQWPQCPIVERARAVLAGSRFHLIHHPAARCPFKFGV